MVKMKETHRSSSTDTDKMMRDAMSGRVTKAYGNAECVLMDRYLNRL